MKSRMPIADMLEIAHTKNPSKRYFRPRSGRSSQRGKAKLRPKSLLPGAPQIFGNTCQWGRASCRTPCEIKTRSKETSTAGTSRPGARAESLRSAASISGSSVRRWAANPPLPPDGPPGRAARRVPTAAPRNKIARPSKDSAPKRRPGSCADKAPTGRRWSGAQTFSSALREPRAIRRR